MHINPNGLRVKIFGIIEKLRNNPEKPGHQRESDLFETEKQFEELIRHMKLDDSVNPSHKAALRIKAIGSYNNNSGTLSRTAIVILSVAALVLMCLVVGRMIFFSPEPKPASPISGVHPVIARADKEQKELSESVAADSVDSGISFVEPVAGRLYSRRAKAGTPNDVGEPEYVKELDELAASGNIGALVDIAKNAAPLARFIAVKYLSDLFDANAVEIFAALESDLDVNDPGSPFYTAHD